MVTENAKDAIKGLRRRLNQEEKGLDPICAQTIDSQFSVTSRIQDSAFISKELYKVYSEYELSGGSNEKNKAFLQALVELTPFMVLESDLGPWCESYLKTALNSGGLDVELVNLSRSLLQKAMSPCDAEEVLSLRTKAAQHVACKIIDVFVDPEKLSLKAEQGGYREETKRFVKMNARELLLHYASYSIEQFFRVVNPYFCDASTRADATSLVSSACSKNFGSAGCIVETELFGNLLNSLLYDRAHDVLDGCVKILVMVIPEILKPLSELLPNVLSILMRLISWADDEGEGPAPGGWVVYNAGDSPPNFDRLFGIMYALFPLNLMSCITDPAGYLGVQHLDHVQIVRRSKKRIKNYQTHENFVVYKSAREELADSKSKWDRLGSSAIDLCQMYSRGDADVSNLEDMLDVHKQLFYKGGGGGGGESSDNLSSEKPSSVDFYQRELLIVKNELDFVTYEKQLLSEKCASAQKLLAQSETNLSLLLQAKSHDAAQSDGSSKLERDLTQLKDDYLKFKATKASYQDGLIEKLKVARNENVKLKSCMEELRKTCSSVKDQNAKCMVALEEKESQVILLHQKVDFKETEVAPSTQDINSEVELLELQVKESRDFVSHLQSQTGELNTRMDKQSAAYKEELYRKEMALEKLEKEAVTRNDLREKLVAKFNRDIALLTENVMNLELEIKAKDERVKSFTESRPINIPRKSFSQKMDNPIGAGEVSLFEQYQTSRTRQKTPAAEPVPVFKGRGGIQKRSKNFM